MHRRTKILIVGHSPVLPTGLAETIRLIFHGLVREYSSEYELHQIGLFHSFAVTAPEWPVYPTKTVKASDGKVCLAVDDLHGSRTLRELIPKLRPDIVFVIGTPHEVSALEASQNRPFKLLLYLKVDDVPIPMTAGSALQQADLILTMSQWSRNALTSRFPEIPADKIDFLYPPADTARFIPLAARDKEENREALLPDWIPRDAFLLGWVGLPRWRKQVWLLYRLIHYLRRGKHLICSDCGSVSLLDWDPVTQSHLDHSKAGFGSAPGRSNTVCSECGAGSVSVAEPLQDVFLWLHMPNDDPLGAWRLDWLEREYGVQRNRDLYYTEGYSTTAALAPADMSALYQLWDCLVYLSGSEGFGLPAWEAMSSALPVIYTNYSSHAEYLESASAGVPVGGILQPEPRTGFWRMIADLPSAIQAVRRLYFDRALGAALGANGRAFARQHNTDLQVKQWAGIFRWLA